MALNASWRLFKRMQSTILAVAALVYVAAAAEAWRVPLAGSALKLARTAIFPGLFFTLSFCGVLLVPVLRAALVRHLWTSYRTGYGQSVISVLGGVGVLIAVSGLIFWQIHQAMRGGGYPGGAFSGYGAGIGLLLAQTVLVRRIEDDPTLRRQIEEG